MSEADRVFARRTTPGSLPAPEAKQFLHVTSRRRGATAGQSRVVEVVHRRSSRTPLPTEPASAPAPSAQAVTSSEEIQGRAVPRLPPGEHAAASPAPIAQVGHLMPGWEPLLPPLEATEPAAEVQASARPQRRMTKPKPPKSQSGTDEARLCRSFRGGRHRRELHPLRLSGLGGTGEARPDDLLAVPLADPLRHALSAIAEVPTPPSGAAAMI